MEVSGKRRSQKEFCSTIPLILIHNTTLKTALGILLTHIYEKYLLNV